MAIKIGINGFGRIGRVALRCMVERGCSTYQICGINLRNADLDYMVYQVKYDSVFRTFQGSVDHDDRHLILNGKRIRVYSEADASKIPWDDCGAEYIIESTGAYDTTEKGSFHLLGGAKKVKVLGYEKEQKKIRKLKPRKTYYMKMRCFFLSPEDGQIYYSDWSNKLRVKTK